MTSLYFTVPVIACVTIEAVGNLVIMITLHVLIQVTDAFLEWIID